MKKKCFLGCLLLLIGIAACEKREEIAVIPSTPSGQFTFDGKSYDLHYCSIRRNPWSTDFYEASLYSHDKTVRLNISFFTKLNGIPSGTYENFGTLVNASEQGINAQFSLHHVPEGETPFGPPITVEFRKNADGVYTLRIYPAEQPDAAENPDTYSIDWSGKLS